MHPSAGLTREYVATTDEAPTRKQVATIAAGGMVDGSFVKPSLVEPDISDPSHGGRKLRIIVSEGRNREVMLQTISGTVDSLSYFLIIVSFERWKGVRSYRMVVKVHIHGLGRLLMGTPCVQKLSVAYWFMPSVAV